MFMDGAGGGAQGRRRKGVVLEGGHFAPFGRHLAASLAWGLTAPHRAVALKAPAHGLTEETP